MFDSILGRGFAPKCKSLIIKLKNRLDVLKRKKKAVVGYLSNDIAELLKAGHDSNAYGRVEGLMHEINRASCYEWIEKFCDCIYKQLSTMQKQGECPAESMEVVSSIMYAAARLNAELPELCTLRRIFTEKYGNGLESLVNQEFVKKIASKPPSMDQKLELMEEISQNFSIKWDLKACKQKLSSHYAAPYGEPTNKRAFENSKDGAVEEKVTSPRGRKEISHNHKDLHDEEEVPSNKRWDLDSEGLAYAKEEQSMQKQPTTDIASGLRYARREQVSTNNKVYHHVTADDNNHPVLSSYGNAAGNAKPRYNRVIPPPYVKPNKHVNNPEAPYVVPDNTKEITSPENKTRASPERSVQRIEKDHHHEDNNLVRESKPKPRSVRRKPARPSPPADEEILVDSPGAVQDNSPVHERKSQVAARWARPRPGFGVSKDEEEAMMDKLLIHYGKKGLRDNPSPRDGQTEESYGVVRDAKEGFNSNHAPNRTSSLPMEPAPEVAKLPLRATSFQPGAGPHVHPKLPDYDDLAARFAALKNK